GALAGGGGAGLPGGGSAPARAPVPPRGPAAKSAPRTPPPHPPPRPTSTHTSTPPRSHAPPARTWHPATATPLPPLAEPTTRPRLTRPHGSRARPPRTDTG